MELQLYLNERLIACLPMSPAQMAQLSHLQIKLVNKHWRELQNAEGNIHFVIDGVPSKMNGEKKEKKKLER